MFFLTSICEKPDILRVIYFVFKLLDVLFMIIPIGLIIMLIIDVFKMMTANDEREIKIGHKTVINRIIFAVAVFFVPTIVSALMNLLNTSVNITSDYGKCLTNANLESIEALAKLEEINKEDENNNTGNNNQDDTDNGNNNGNQDDTDNGNQDDNNNDDGNNNGIESSGNLYQDLANSMIKIASDEVGTKEGDNNDNPYGKDLGINNEPWCAIFVTWVAKKTTVNGTNLFDNVIQKEDNINNPYSAVNSIYTFKNNSNLNFYFSKHYGGNYTPKKGDYIYYNYDGNWNKKIYSEMGKGSGDHVGIVEYVEGGYVHTIEGNYENKVARVKVSLDSKTIMGYGSWYK